MSGGAGFLPSQGFSGVCLFSRARHDPPGHMKTRYKHWKCRRGQHLKTLQFWRLEANWRTGGGSCGRMTLPKTNSKSHWKWMVGIRVSFWYGLFSGANCYSFRECNRQKKKSGTTGKIFWEKNRKKKVWKSGGVWIFLGDQRSFGSLNCA